MNIVISYRFDNTIHIIYNSILAQPTVKQAVENSYIKNVISNIFYNTKHTIYNSMLAQPTAYKTEENRQNANQFT